MFLMHVKKVKSLTFFRASFVFEGGAHLLPVSSLPLLSPLWRYAFPTAGFSGGGSLHHRGITHTHHCSRISILHHLNVHLPFDSIYHNAKLQACTVSVACLQLDLSQNSDSLSYMVVQKIITHNSLQALKNYVQISPFQF